MGSFFAVQVMTGKETRTKDLLKQSLFYKDMDLVKGIYANETHTEFVNHKTKSVNDDFLITEEDISLHLEKERMRSYITNRRLQLEAIEKYDSLECEVLKKEYRKEISQLEKQVREMKERSKAVHSVLNGYILIELSIDVLELPPELWHVIKNTPNVISILSSVPIPKHEVDRFFEQITSNAEPEIVVSFDKELSYDDCKEKQFELLDKLNAKDSNLTKSEIGKIENELDNVHENIVSKVNTVIDSKPVNHFVRKVRAYVKRKHKMVSLPKRIFNKLYGVAERSQIGNLICEKDFIKRFTKLFHQHEGYLYG